MSFPWSEHERNHDNPAPADHPSTPGPGTTHQVLVGKLTRALTLTSFPTRTRATVNPSRQALDLRGRRLSDHANPARAELMSSPDATDDIFSARARAPPPGNLDTGV
ncbi:hypothetical protein BN12_1530001 [Nostocoides japonicum T1-X7]|uniref:Uncharacterized protein n=1 Tax=Nostocoides japonicum T1-X7 TaxID=1194083 RepID=A0A077LVR5_9MICO|nr:hypothetical protein BN12_1530001 [Tetrasphaera japonica T1-X7]